MFKQRKLIFLTFVSLRSKSFLTRLLWSGFLLFPLVLFSSLPSAAEEVEVAAYPTFKFNGDFRFRHEHLETQGGAISSLEQQRIRARLGSSIKIDEQTHLEFRMATGGGRASTNQSLGNNTATSTQAMASYPFMLDLAHADFAALESLHLKAGRFANPFYQPANSDMIWDGDLNFDGLALKYKAQNDTWIPFANAGFFWILKDLGTPRKDVILGALQLGVQNKISTTTQWSIESAFYAYSGIRTHQGLASSASTNGNTYEQSGAIRRYQKSYKLIDLGIDFSTPFLGKNITLFNHYVTNTKSNPRPGVILGFKFGQLNERGDWNLNYDYRRVPEDSTVGAFSDGDSFGGGSNGWSHRVSTAYQLQKSWNTALNYFYGKANIAKGNIRLNRQAIQLDLNFKF